MSFNPREERAIYHHLKHNPHLRLTLQTQRSRVHFQDKASSADESVPMDTLLDSYDTDRREAAKERARARREKAKEARR